MINRLFSHTEPSHIKVKVQYTGQHSYHILFQIMPHKIFSELHKQIWHPDHVEWEDT